MDRLTKIVVTTWACLALACDVWLVSTSWPSLPLLALVAAAALFALTFFDQRAVGLVLASAYIFPVAVWPLHGGPPYAPNAALWMAALLGAILPQALRTRWHIPAPWRPVLVAAALVIVVTSPIVALREIDLNAGLLGDRQGWSFAGAIWPSLAVTWILHSSLTLVLGLLWFDWLCGARDLNLRNAIVAPLAAGALALSAVAIYQLLVDVHFLNPTVYAYIGRASGTMFDANVTGTLAALWIGGMYAWARHVASSRPALITVAILLNGLAVWASGSRTAFFAATIVTIFIGTSIVLERERPGARGIWMMLASVVALALVVVAAGSINPRIVGPLGRVWATLPGLSVESVRAFVAEMWNRNGYGTAATAMFREVPWFGIGVGTYHTLAATFLPGNALPPDNAQNWLRHQIVELGLVGALAWVAWFVIFAIFVLRMRRTDSTDAWATRGALVAFAVISLLGMPGQDVMVAVTFWTFAFWYTSAVGAPEDRHLPRWSWAAVAVVVVAAGAGTAQLALTRLRLPVRALTATWPYSYGFSAPGARGADDGYRRARTHAVAVIDVPARWLEVSVRLDAGAADGVDVRVWTNGGTLLKGRLEGVSPLTAIVELPAEPKRVLLEAEAQSPGAHRTPLVRGADPQFLVKWEFHEHPPASHPGYPPSSS